MDPRVNERQLEVLRWVADGCPDGKWAEGDFTYKLTANALKSRRLVKIRKGNAVEKRWECTITEAGRHYLEHGDYPPGHVWSKVTMKPIHEEPKARGRPVKVKPTPDPALPEDDPPVTGPIPKPRDGPPEWEIDSPNSHARREAHERRQPLDTRAVDPWGDRIMITVKEAAWLLGLTEHAIRDAVRNEDVQRVFIGKGTTHYRIVYQSLLAWVDAMPRSPYDGWRGSKW